MSSDRYTGRAVVVGEYAGADSTIILAIDQRVDIIKKSEKWWYVSDGAVKGYFPALCLRELHPDEVPPLPQGWNKNISSDGRVYYYNEESGQSQWEYPKVLKPPPPPPRPKSLVHAESPAPLPDATHSRNWSTGDNPLTAGPVIAELLITSPTARSRRVMVPPPLLSVRPRHTPQSSMEDIPAPKTPVGSFGGGSILQDIVDEEEVQCVYRDSLPSLICYATQASFAKSLLLDNEPVFDAVPKKAPPPPVPKLSYTVVPISPVTTPRLASGRADEILPPDLKQDIEQFSINGFADVFFNSHKKWTLFRGRQKLKPEELLSYSKSGLRQSLTRLSKCSELFAIKLFPKILAAIDNEKRRGSTKGAFEETFHELIISMDAQIRKDHFFVDEVFCQILKESTNNPVRESTERGWALLYACILCFSPSRELGKYLYRQSRPLRQENNPIGGFAICINKIILQQLQSSSRLPDKISANEISLTHHIEPVMRYHIPAALFGCPLECLSLWETVQLVADGMGDDIRGSMMSLLGRDTVSGSNVDIGDQLPTLTEILACENPPGLLLMLCNAVINLGAPTKLGIFREAANVDVVKGFIDKLKCGDLDCFLFAQDTSNESKNVGIDVVNDVLVACDILKIWLRRLPEPIVPYCFYEQCVKAGSLNDISLALDVLSKMPALYRASLAYLCKFIKYLSHFAAVTMMEVSNLCLVFAPNCIKNPSDDASTVFMNAEIEKRCLQLFVTILGGNGDIWPPQVEQI